MPAAAAAAAEQKSESCETNSPKPTTFPVQNVFHFGYVTPKSMLRSPEEKVSKIQAFFSTPPVQTFCYIFFVSDWTSGGGDFLQPPQ
jgi:hypothetical protein